MHQYGVRDVERLLRLSRNTIRALVDAGFVSPARGPRNSWQFSFQDLIVLRTAQTLADAQIPPRRISQSLRALRLQLPETMPLSGLSIGAVGDHVVVKDGSGQRRADSGQYLLAFEGDPATGSLSVIERKRAPAARTIGAATLVDQALAMEQDEPDTALRLYERAIAAEPERLDARINRGRLLHEAGKLDQAGRAYREAIKHCGGDGLLLYNYAILLEDMNRKQAAFETYKQALRDTPDFADCHYNLALLCEQLRKPKDAIRHMAQYRRLTSSER
jgi:tetratricopeptide (TPR) repeat protein